MRAFALSAAAATALLAPAAQAMAAYEPEFQQLVSRATTQDAMAAADKAFDFIVVGGGLAGLTVASRLTEWNNVTVLVLEAGGTGDESQNIQDRVDMPGKSYINSLTGTEYDWKYKTVQQPKSGNQQKSWPRGKILGGSGAVNGLFWCRGDKDEYDAWASLNPGTNETWDWNEVNKYIMKAENFMEPPTDMVNQMSLKYDAGAHGSGGPISVGYSQYIYPVTSNWIPSWTELGFDAKDLAGGSTRGVMLTPSTLNRDTQSRCDSKVGYLDPHEDRGNLVVLTGQQVTKIVFNGTNDAQGNPIASGVTFSAGPGQKVFSAQAKKEVILSGGTVGSAQILQLSGVGPANVLQGAGVPVVKDLPVGYNLQDHVSNTMYFNTQPIDTWYELANNKGLQDEEAQKWKNSAQGLWTYVNEAVGYISGADLYGTGSAAASNVDVDAMLTTLDGDIGLPASVKNGIRAQLELQKQWLSSTVGQFEIILHLWGQTANNIGIQVALQHPFSRGTLFITSDSAWDSPSINPNYFGIDKDAEMGARAQEWVRKLVATPTWKKIITAEVGRDGSKGPTDDQGWFAYNGKTEYHPLGSCSMLPEDQGGVVDTNLKVHGISNVRVIDASIMPIHVSAHLMASTYGIAEKGADIIKAKYVYVPPPPSPSTSASSGASSTGLSQETQAGPATTAEIEDATDSAIKSAAADGNAKASSGQMTMGTKIGIGVGVGCGVLALLAAILFVVGAARKNKRRAASEKGWYAGPSADGGAWDAGAAYSEQEGYPMAPPRGRPFSSAGASVSTMATADLYHPTPGSPSGHGDGYDAYSMGDYSRGGAQSPYRDFVDEQPSYPTPGTPGSPGSFTGQGSPMPSPPQWGAQTYTPVTPR
ncbi:hypothetical protein A1Q2_06020 [Trichosporon asahii var. asahii CBS 8904]|uniref:Glucose-methanol-choline oxidoreductase N-terminal domain-containing protein n=1 Tax=Trichosporon asahii var. asahii (strain CBS 8904) TaxID=1220162 RepID=K1VG07_TRIAC|nr:hypothetical protein A1Q2_06020 [Trichosporon asahii var. asahii CBS 8904]